MDVFKLAFETTIVGLLTIGWLTVAAHLLFPDFRFGDTVKKPPDFVAKYPTAVGVGVLILAYCLGSAVLPIAKQLVNDEHWPLNEDAIRCQVFTQAEKDLETILETRSTDSPAIPYLTREKMFSRKDLEPRHCSYWAPIFRGGIFEVLFKGGIRFFRRWIGLPASGYDPVTGKPPEELAEFCKRTESTECNEFKAGRILTIFQQQETIVLSQPSDRSQDLRQLHERIVVLRGAVFSTFILLLICIFAYCARVNDGASHKMRSAFGILLGVAFLVFALVNGYNDVTRHNIFDIPVLESLLLVIIGFGVWLARRRDENGRLRRFHSRRFVLISLFFTGLAYGGWMWSEIIYDQQVISSFVSLQHEPPSTTPRAD